MGTKQRVISTIKRVRKEHCKRKTREEVNLNKENPGGLPGTGRNIERWVTFNRLPGECWGWKTDIPMWTEKLQLQHGASTVAVYVRI